MDGAGFLRFSRSTSLLIFLLAVGCASGPPQSGASVPGQLTSPAQDDLASGQEGLPRPEGQEQEVGDRPGVGVWPFSNGGSFGSDPWDYEALGIGLQQMLITELSHNSGLRLVERSRLREIIEELELGQGGLTDPSTTASVGKLVQARYMIVGGFVDADGTMRLDARIDDVETGEVLVETAAKVQDDRENLLDMVIELGIKLVEAANLPPLPEEILEERRSLNYPPEAVQLYSRALRREERGDLDGMVDLLRQLASDFPQHIEGRQMLEQYGVGENKDVDPSSRRRP
jgi:curli biogenesis system outer membrane secretion channel CsgG